MYMKFGQLTLAGLLFTAASGFAATVQLNDGKIVDGDVVRENPAMIWMNINGDTYELSRSNVLWFSSDKIDHRLLRTDVESAPFPYRREPAHISGATEAAPATPANPPVIVVLQSENRAPKIAPLAPVANQPVAVVPAPVTRVPVEIVPAPKEDPEPVNTNFVPATPAPTQRETLPRMTSGLIPVTEITIKRPEAEINTLRNSVLKLSDAADANDRREAIDALRASGDAGLAMLIQDGLYNSIPSVRTRAVEVLATNGGSRVLKPLIEAFYSAANNTIPPYQVAYVNMLASQISRLTGQDYNFFSRRTARGPEIATEMVAWWNMNFDRYPQLGETHIDPSAPSYAQTVRLARTLVLVHRDFGGANLPLEIAVPASGVDAETQVNTVNGIPRASDNSSTERLNPAQEPSVPKIPDDALSAPGKWREEQQIERRKQEIEAR